MEKYKQTKNNRIFEKFVWRQHPKLKLGIEKTHTTTEDMWQPELRELTFLTRRLSSTENGSRRMMWNHCNGKGIFGAF